MAVVGAGLTGLLAALRLQEAGIRPLVFEASDAPGGMVHTLSRDGWRFELGCSTLASGSAAVNRLLDAAIAEADRVRLQPVAARRYLVHQGKLELVPDSPAQLVATPLLSLPGRMRLLREPFVAAGGDPEETVAAFANRRFGPEMTRAFFEPLLAGTAGGDAEQLLARYALPRLVEYERSSGSVLKGRLRAARAAKREGRGPAPAPWRHREGLAALAQALANRIEGGIRTDARVARVAQSGEALLIGEDQGAEHKVDGILLAVGAPALGRIDFDLPGRDAIGQVASMPHASLVVVALGFRREAVQHPLDGRGVLAAASERRRFLSIQFASSQFTNCAPEGHVALTVTLGGSRHPALVNSTESELLGIAKAEVHEQLGASGEPVIEGVHKWPAALPLAVAGHTARIAAADEFEMLNPGIAFAGPWRDGISAMESMDGGVAAVYRLAGRAGWLVDPKES